MSHDPPPTRQAHPSEGIAVAVWGVVLFVGCRLVEIFLDAQPTASALGQAVLVEFGAARLGVVWSAEGSSRTPFVRAALGGALGLGAGLLLYGLLAATGAVITHRVESVEPAVLFLGLGSAAVLAWRDELLFHGITLRALDTVPSGHVPVGAVVRTLACGATSAGAALGRPSATAQTVVASALLGIVFGSLWVQDRGAWRPWAASTSFRFLTQTIVSGGLVEAHRADNGWAGGAGAGGAGWLSGAAATVALAPLAVACLARTAHAARKESTAPAT